MNSIESCILEIVSGFDDGKGIYNDDEVYICDLVDALFESRGIKQYYCDVETMFENPGIDVYSFSCCWVENGELKSLLNLQLERY